MDSSPRERSSVRSLRGLLTVALCLVTLPFVLKAAAPGWWTDRGVVDVSRTANDYAAVNQGQVKHLALQAMEELDAHLPGGAGEAVHDMVDGWSATTVTTNDFSPVKLGALKALAEPFYTELIRVGYVENYPWVGHEASANNHAAANIGQAKNLFSFDVTYDNDHDGLPDWWEKHWFGPNGVDPAQIVDWGVLTVLQAYQQGLNPKDFYNGRTPKLHYESGSGQESAPGSFVLEPIVASVYDDVRRVFFAGAPVTFSVGLEGGMVQRSSNSVPGTTITVLANSDGLTRVFYKLPSVNPTTSNPITCHLTASTGTGNARQSVSFTESAVAGIDNEGKGGAL